MSAAVIKNDNFGIDGLVITIKGNKALHRFVNKIAGASAQLRFEDIIGHGRRTFMATQSRGPAGVGVI